MSDVDRVTIVTGAPPLDPTHDARMIARAEGTPAVPSTTQPAGDERPSWLPEKFSSAEAMAASYKELEARLSSHTAAPAATPPVTPPAALAVPAAATTIPAGLDMAAFAAEFARDGKLSDASYATLANSGFNKDFVDVYVEGQQARQTAFQSEVLAQTPGGAEKYPEMIAWARANLTPSEVAAFNTAVTTNNKDSAKLAVAGLGARFMAAVGNEPTLQGGRTSATAAGDVFESIAEMRRAMSDPLYRSDSAYREKVRAKLGRSSIM
jgi:uncharacterized protein (DUF1330 family)